MLLAAELAECRSKVCVLPQGLKPLSRSPAKAGSENSSAFLHHQLKLVANTQSRLKPAQSALTYLFIGALMLTRLRRYVLSCFDTELADLQRELVLRDDRIAALQRRLGEIDSQHDQTAVVLAAERDRARHDADQLAVELTDIRHELDKTSKALAVAEEENRRLWAVCQRDHARVAKERALLDRARAEAETALSVGQAEA